VVVSHGHYDHFDMEGFAAYPDKSVPMAVKRGLGAKARSYGFTDVTELDAWQTAALGPVRVTAAPAKHKVPEVTFMLEGAGSRVFFGADTMRIAELDDLVARFGEIDLALLPINGLTIRPLLNRQVVMNAVEAADLTRVLHPRLAVPIHYAFTGGPIRDRFLLKKDPRPEVFLDAAADVARTPRSTCCIPANRSRCEHRGEWSPRPGRWPGDPAGRRPHPDEDHCGADPGALRPRRGPQRARLGERAEPAPA
jgi:L-ascorbate metabolism protein UlaG (beta-lactamase superfamily)